MSFVWLPTFLTSSVTFINSVALIIIRVDASLKTWQKILSLWQKPGRSLKKSLQLGQTVPAPWTVCKETALISARALCCSHVAQDHKYPCWQWFHKQIGKMSQNLEAFYTQPLKHGGAVQRASRTRTTQRATDSVLLFLISRLLKNKEAVKNTKQKQKHKLTVLTSAVWDELLRFLFCKCVTWQ